METYVGLLQSYQSRDKILRIVGYASAFATGAFKGHMAKTLGIIAQRISAARTVNRLFDEIPMWTVTRTLGAGERDIVSRGLSAVANIIMQCYFPLEKLAWAGDNEILELKTQPLWNAAISIWGVYMVLHVIRSIRQLSLMKHKIIKIAKQKRLESPEKNDEKAQEYRRSIGECRATQQKELLMLIKNLADLVMVVNWLPLGILWSGKLSPARNAFFGTISSIVSLYLTVQQYHDNKQKKQ